MAHALVIEDSPEYLATICEMLASGGHTSVGVGSAYEAHKVLKEQEFDLIICDMGLPVFEGTAEARYSSPDVGASLVAEFSQLFPALPIIAISGSVPLESLPEAASYGATACLGKPFSLDKLLKAVSSSLRIASARM